MVLGDFAFICDAFWRSSKQSKSMDEVKEIVANSDCLIACLKEDQNIIISFIIHKDKKPIWSYTKVAFRKMGINSYLKRKIEA
jgi:hypothetical protein